MPNPLDIRTRSNVPICDLIFAPIVRAGQRPLVVDVGARSGMLELPSSYTNRANLIGFEPNPVEHEKLIAHDTDPVRAGHRPPPFADEKYLDKAIWDREGSETLVITNGPGTPTLMGAADRTLTSNMYLEGQKLSFYDAALQSVDEETIQTQRLDELISQGTTIDFLKIDVEGAELRVLKGASGLLSRRDVLVIRSEFVTVPYYKEHPILGDQHLFLHEFGFRLIDIDLGAARYTRGPTRIPRIADRTLLYGGDAVYILDPDRVALDPLELQRMAALSLGLGFSSLATSVLRDAALLSDSDIEDIEEALAKVPLRRRVLSAWERTPHKLERGLTLARRFINKTGDVRS